MLQLFSAENVCWLHRLLVTCGSCCQPVDGHDTEPHLDLFRVISQFYVSTEECNSKLSYHMHGSVNKSELFYCILPSLAYRPCGMYNMYCLVWTLLTNASRVIVIQPSDCSTFTMNQNRTTENVFLPTNETMMAM